MNRLQISLLEEFNMLNFLSENLGTIVVGAVLAGLVVLAILSLRKDSKKSPCSMCGGGCSHCSRSCHSDH